MTVPDGAILGALASVAGYSAYLSRQIAKSYFEQVASQTAKLDRLVDEQNAHDELSAEAHKHICEGLAEVVESLRRLNGGAKQKGRPRAVGPP